MNFKIAGFFLHLLADCGDFLQNCMIGQPWAMFSAFGDVFSLWRCSPELDASIGPRTLGLP